VIDDAFDIPNRHGLRAEEFDYDMESYRAALGFLGDVSCGTPEQEALRIEGGTPEMMRSWEGSRRFRRALGRCREQGAEDREYAARKAERRQDVFATPPRPGAPDLAAETYDLQSPPRTGMGGWLRRLKQAWLAQPAEEPATSSGQRFIAGDDLTPEQLQAIRFQEAAQRQPEQSRSIFTQKPAAWSGKGMADDGSMWAD
jgi:hypothetical protein